MLRIGLTTLVVSAFATMLAFAAEAKEPISEVTEVSVVIEKKNPPAFVVTASGNAATPNWTDPELVLIQEDPVDGIYMTQFVAEKPSGIQIQQITPIGPVELTIEAKDDLLIKGVEVKAQTNCILYVFTDEVLANPDRCDVIATM